MSRSPAAAVEVWRRLIAKDPHTDWKWANKLTDLLIAQDKLEEAGTVWHQAVEHERRFHAGLYREFSGL